MRLLSRYVFKEILSSALLGTFLATAVIFLQGVGKIFEILVRSTASWQQVAYLFALSLPPVLPMTIPFGVLVGILIGLGRMSSDGEVTAMRAAGVSSRRVTIPVLVFAGLATVLTAECSLRWTPLALRETYRVVNQLAATQLSADIQARVFEEDFPNTILYVGDVRPGPTTLWRNVFIADVTPPEQRKSGLQDKAQGPLITVAREAVAVPDAAHNRIQLSLRDASTHEMGKDAVANDAWFPAGEQALQAAPPAEVHARPFREMNTREVWQHVQHGPESLEARIELHQRLALPLACIVLALVGIPLGVSSRKGGKSAGYITAVFLGFFCYWLALITLINLARQRTLPVGLAVWLPNLLFFVCGTVFLLRLEKPGDRDFTGMAKEFGRRVVARLQGRLAPRGERNGAGLGRRLPLLPQIIDTYVLSNFLFYFLLMLGSFVSMTLVYNFFELLSDIVKNKIPLLKVFTYLAFLTPMLIYDTLPISVLVGVLVTFGVLTKNNEVTAFKASGVSVHRLSVPVLLISLMLSGGLFAFDYYYVPDANRKQDALRNEIKGRPVQTYLRPDRKWIKGAGSRIYYYQYFDQSALAMAGVSVFELDPKSFDLTRQISAERAHWEPWLHTWVFENGWTRDFRAPRGIPYTPFQVMTFSELNEPPNYFLKEVLEDKQMNFVQLAQYIRDLDQSGFDTVKLRVQFYRKFSVPLFALIMAMISVPFGFLVGNRGAMAGIGVSIGIAVSYWAIGTLFEKIGDVNQLPSSIAAWSPDALFALCGLYLLLRMRS